MTSTPKKQSQVDGPARWGVAISFGIALLSVFYARSSGPFYFAQPSSLHYREFIDVDLSKDGLPWRSEVTITIENKSSSPARDVDVQIESANGDPEVLCTADCAVKSATRFLTLVSIRRIPAKSEVTITVKEETDVYTSGKETYYPPSPRGVAVRKMYTEFGEIRKDVSRSYSNMPPPPPRPPLDLRLQ